MENAININKYLYYTQLATKLSLYRQQEIVLFCAGNYKIYYDSFASMMAERLKAINISCFIYGGINHPILPFNLEEYINFIKLKHPRACIIVFDNVLTERAEECGDLIISDRSSQIAYYSKNLSFGNISILFKTYLKTSFSELLKKQVEIVYILEKIFKLLINNNLIA